MVLGLQTLGYEEHVVLPLTVALRRAGESVTLSGKLAYLACAELCVPHEAELSLTIPPGTGAAGPEAHLIERFRAVVPQPAQQAGIGFEALGWRLDGDTVLVQGRAKAPMGFSEPDVILEGPEGSFFDPPKMMVRGQTVLFELSGGGVRLEGEQPLPITLTLLDEGLAVEQSLMAAPGLETGSGSDFAAVSSRDEASSQTLMGVLLLALLGGLVLNLMPCVLPVLSLKLMAVLQPGRQDPSRMRLGFLVAAAGIITAFIGLAAGLAVVKAAGAVVGWGIQFQQPVFLVIMVAVMLLFAASLLGLFEVRLPAALMGRMAGGGQSGLSGDFASGLFATLLATPCSAPFVGTAVGFALTQGTSVILLVFAVMGIGTGPAMAAGGSVPDHCRRPAAPARPVDWLDEGHSGGGVGGGGAVAAVRPAGGGGTAGGAVRRHPVGSGCCGADGPPLAAGNTAGPVWRLALRRADAGGCCRSRR